jgi:hypothetical protein
VDVDGGDIYDEGLTDNAPWTFLEDLYRLALSHRKPFSVPEWGLIGVDDTAFVEHMCSFLRNSGATEMQAFFAGRPGSALDLGSKPKSAAAYRQCLTPLAGPLPGWAAGVAARIVALSLTPNPASGPSPLAVQFAVVAKLNVPIQHWQLFFGDGGDVERNGTPPATVNHTYPQDGDYQATLIVYPTPPFKPEVARFIVAAAVTAGAPPKPLVAFKAGPTGGRAPLAVSFQTDLDLPAAVVRWEIVLGDGFTRNGTGTPPHFAGHTYERPGSYQPILIVDTSQGGRFVALAVVTVSGAASPPPAKATRTGTVLVNGKPFSGGTIKYGSKVDVTKGTLALRTDTGTLSVYGAGVPAAFVLLRGTDSGKPIVELRLTGGNFKTCGKTVRTTLAAGAKKPPKTVRRLWGKGKGRFRTRGRYAAAVVRGTWWLTADRCDGTLVTVKQGTVRVTDLRKHKTVSVKAGRSYLAKP